MVCGLVSDSANHGQVKENPFLFEHNHLNFIQVTVDGQDMTQAPLQPRYGDEPEDGMYIDAYSSVCGINGFDESAPITRKEYPEGFCFYRFVSEAIPGGNDDVIPLRRRGNMRVSVKFEKKLTQPTTLIIFAKFPAALKIDKNRAVHEV
jgi:hypothetical protein